MGKRMLFGLIMAIAVVIIIVGIVFLIISNDYVTGIIFLVAGFVVVAVLNINKVHAKFMGD